MSVDEIVAEVDLDVIALSSTDHEFVRIGAVEAGDSEMTFSVRVREVGSISVRESVRFEDVDRVGSFRSTSFGFGSSEPSYLGGYETIGTVRVSRTGNVTLATETGEVSEILFDNEVNDFSGGVRLEGSSVSVGSIGGLGSFSNAGLSAESGMDLQVGGDLRCARFGLLCNLAGVDLTITGTLTLGPSPIGPDAEAQDFVAETLRGPGDLVLLGTGLGFSQRGLGVEVGLIDLSGTVTADDPGFTVRVRDRATFRGDVDVSGVRFEGDSDPDREAFAFEAGASLPLVSFDGVNVRVAGEATYVTSLGTETELVNSTLTVSAGGRLTVTGNPGAIAGEGGDVDNAGTLVAGPFVRFDVPVTTTGTLLADFYDADTAPPVESDDPFERFSRAPFFADLTAGGTLRVEPDGGPAPPVGAERILFFYDRLTGAFDALDLPALPDGWRWDVTFEDGVARATVVPSTETVACSVASPLSFDADGDGGPSTVSADDFNVSGNDITFGEFVAVRNEGSGPSAPTVDLSACSFVVFNPFSERVTYVAETGGAVDPDDVFVLATRNGDQGLPPSTLPDGPGAFALVEGGASAGDRVSSVLGRVVAAVVYIGDDVVFGARGGAGASARRTGEAFAEAVRAAAQTVGPADLAVSAWPNPSAGRATVRFGLAEGGAVRVAVYDVLGREVAVVAERAFGPGRHEVSVGGLPAGAYVVRVTSGGEARTARMTVTH